VSIVPPTNTVVDPWTVMVERLHTSVAVRAVRTARRPVKLTGNTPLHPDLDAIYVDRLIKRSSKVVVGIFIGRSPRNHTRIHESGQSKVGHDKEGHNCLDNNPRGMVFLPYKWGTKDKVVNY